MEKPPGDDHGGFGFRIALDGQVGLSRRCRRQAYQR